LRLLEHYEIPAMTLYKPDYAYSDLIQEITTKYSCDERASEEVLQYARVLNARKMPLEMLIASVARYAKIRGKYCDDHYEFEP
jgi:hypothetical protein